MVTLTQKEKTLLQDEKSHEQLCIEKYDKYSNSATDPQLKSLFQTINQHEHQHLDSINQILNGTVPNVNAGQSSGQAQATPQATSQQPATQSATNTQSDAYLCTDALSTEKYVSSTYNSTIFEFRDPSIRQVLNHIQKEEQEHGEQIFNYMAQHGMYNAQ